MKLLKNLRAFVRKKKLEREMAEEMQAHLELQQAENLRRGMSPDEARYAAQREFGNLGSLQERAREQRGFLWLEHLLQDVRFAARMLRKTPGFTLVAAISLAIGIGLNTAVFSIINTLFYQTIRGVPEPQRVLIFNDAGASLEGFRLLRQQANDVAALAAGTGVAAVIETAGGDRRGRIAAVSADYFSVLGARAALGRFFVPPPGVAPEDHAEPEAVLTHAFWEKHLARDRAILGRVLRVNGVSVTVIGVAAPQFHGPGPEGPAMWVPLGLARSLLPTSRSAAATDRLGVIGRLRPGTTLGEAQAAVSVIAARSPEVFGTTRHRLSLGREDWRGEESPEKRTEFLLVTTVPLVVVGGLLWIACSNVANLLLARAVHRRKEIAIRVASGASRGRLIRMLMVESVILALLGGAAGLWVCVATLDFVFATLSEFSALSVQLDFRVLCYTTAVCVVAAVLFGLVPALQASKTDVNGALKGDGDQPTFRGSRLRALFLVSQIASSVALLVVAGTFIKTLIAGAYVGEQARFMEQMVWAQLPSFREEQGAVEQRVRRITEQIRALPAVAAVTVAEQNAPTRVVTRPGESRAENETAPTVPVQRIDGEFVRTAGLTLSRGAMLSATGAEHGLRELVVNEPMARFFWPQAEPVGARLDLDGQPFTIVGVVRDGTTRPKAYTQLPLASLQGAVLLIRAHGKAAAAVPSIAALLRGHAAENELLHVAPLRDVLFRPVSLLARLGAYVGFLALSLAAAGVYASMAFSTSQRTREIGIRMALGATRSSVLALVLRSALKVIGGGTAIGLILALVGLRLLTGLIGGGAGVDALAVGAVIAFFAAVAAGACLVPAWRGAKVNPVEALRAD